MNILDLIVDKINELQPGGNLCGRNIFRVDPVQMVGIVCSVELVSLENEIISTCETNIKTSNFKVFIQSGKDNNVAAVDVVAAEIEEKIKELLPKELLHVGGFALTFLGQNDLGRLGYELTFQAM